MKVSIALHKKWVSSSQLRYLQNGTGIKDISNGKIAFEYYNKMNYSSFKLENSPPTIASILMRPNIPIHIRKGSLMAVHSTNSMANSNGIDNSCDSVSLSREFVNIWSNIINYSSLKSSQFFKLILNKNQNLNNDCKLLLSTNSTMSKNIQTTLYHLNLNGENDWNIWGKDSIIAFEENSSLEIKPSSYVSFKKLNNLKKFNIIKGRGNILINGIGSIIKIDLNDSQEKILVNYRNLLALNGKSQIDINQSINNKLLPNSNNFNVNNYVIKAKPYPSLEFKNIIYWISVFYKNSRLKIMTWYNSWKHGLPIGFIEISGPRTLLLQSLSNANLNSENINYQYQEQQKRVFNDLNSMDDIKNDNSTMTGIWNVNISKDGRVNFIPANNKQVEEKKV